MAVWSTARNVQSVKAVTSTHPKTEKQMGVHQELLNAGSMVFPSIYCLYYCMRWNTMDLSNERDRLVVYMVLGTVAHMPWSVLYHLQCALMPHKDKIDNNFRRLDQTFIAVAAIMFSFALTGSTLFFYCCSALNGIVIYRLWSAGNTSPQRKVERRLGLALTTLVYQLPIAVVHSPLHFVKCFVTFFASAFAFARPEFFGGFGSFIFHVGMTPYIMLLLDAIPDQMARQPL
jgi:hypothetical protein